MGKVIALVVFILLVLAFGPILTIWALNTLFPALAIPYTFETWAAVVLLGSLGNVRISKRD
jgi:hypothetical protein